MNPATEIKVEQGTDGWDDQRLGRCTASRFSDVLAKIGKGEASARKNYRAELVIERLLGRTPERFKSGPMAWGADTEPLARVEYTLKTGNIVDECGFFLHPELEAGASPDGLINENGLLEIKSPNTATHIETLRTGEVPAKYVPQVMGQLWLTNRAWADFVSFEPDFPENAQLFIKRVPRDDEYISNLAMEVMKFLSEVNQEVSFVKEYRR